MIDFKDIPVKRNLIVILVACVVLIVFDQATKSWADQNLATHDHPLPVQVEETSLVRDGLIQELGISLEEAKQMIEDRAVVLLGSEPLTDPDVPAFAETDLIRGEMLYVFHRGLDRSPRVVSTIHTAVKNKWLAPTISSGKRKVLSEELGSQSLADVVCLDQHQLSRESVESAFREGRVFSARRLAPVDSEKEMNPGQIALVRQRNVEVISGFFQYRYAENPGAAWSFMATASPGFRFWFFTVVASIAVVVLLFLSLTQAAQNLLPLVAYSSILGGAIGNLIDRIQSNFVIDFLDMYVGNSHWPTYNIADVGISAGVAILLFDMLRVWRAERAASRAS